MTDGTIASIGKARAAEDERGLTVARQDELPLFAACLPLATPDGRFTVGV